MEGTTTLSVNDFLMLIDYKNRALSAEQKIATIQDNLAKKVDETIGKGGCFVSVELNDFAPVIDVKTVEDKIWEEYWRNKNNG